MDKLQLISGKELDFKLLDKELIKIKASDIKFQVLEGNIDALEALVIAKKIQQYGDELEAQIRPIAEDKSTIGKGQVYSRFSVDVCEKVVGSKTDYSYCNDPQWESLQQTLSEIKAEIKQRETFLNAITEETTIVTKDGEIITINPPIKSGRIGLALTLK